MTPEQVSSDPVQPTGDLEPMTDAQILQWIDACNHEPAKETLRHYLALRSALAARSGPEAGKAVDAAVTEGRLEDKLAEVLGIKQYPSFAALGFDELLDIVRDRLASVPAPSGEPVAWQYRYADYNTGKPVEWRNGKGEAFAPLPGYERRSIPQAVPAEDVAEPPPEIMESFHEVLNEVADLDGVFLAEHWMERAEKAEAEATSLRRHIGEILAVIHRDGGHYQDFAGTEQAVADAQSAVVLLFQAQDERNDLRRKLEEAEAEIERMTPKYVAYEYLESPDGREIAEARVAVLEKALTDIAESDDIENALDPARNKRVARSALATVEGRET